MSASALDPMMPEVNWFQFAKSPLEKTLGLSPPPFTTADEAFRQLRYVERYAVDLQCQAIAVETHYIDRDHIEDHSVFYAKSFFPYPNYCRRVHFFSVTEEEARQRLRGIVEIGIQSGETAYRQACKEFSAQAYLGFAVIKPLHGSPVGKTVLRCFPEKPDDVERREEFRRDFRCTRDYSAHFAGVELTVRGLAFQQQDVGVSACATTALWSALQKSGDHEGIAAATPAQITMLAARYSLPFGRSMPSEGLNVDQMCQAVQAVGVAPNLFRIEDVSLARAYLYSALRSGFAPVLILETAGLRHAVTVVGMKTSVSHRPSTLLAQKVDDAANDLLGLYIHDDRLGPYLRADMAIKKIDREDPITHRMHVREALELLIPHRISKTRESWGITHVLIPMHAKIRLSFSGLRHVANRAAKMALAYPHTYQIPDGEIPDPTITLDTWIVRAHKYVESLFLNADPQVASRVTAVCETISLARYIGIVRLFGTYFDPIDIVVDTTSTIRNAHCLGVIVVNDARSHTSLVAQHLAIVLGCRLVS